MSGNYINKLLTSGIKKDKKYNYKIADKWKSIIKKNNCVIEKNSKFHLLKSNSTNSENLVLDLKENGLLKKELLLLLLENKFIITETLCSKLLISRKETQNLFKKITKISYQEFRILPTRDKCRIIVTNLLKYANSISLIKYFEKIGCTHLCSVKKCFEVLDKKINYEEEICERDFLILILAVYVEHLKILDASFIYDYYNLYFQKHENSCTIKLSSESEREFSRALVMYENIKNGKIINLYINYQVPSLDKVFGDGYFFTGYVVNMIGDDFYEYRYIFERFISTCILNDLDTINDMNIDISNKLILSSHIKEVSINCDCKDSINNTLSLKANREFLLRGSEVVSNIYCAATFLIESGIPFCVFAIYRCIHNYPNVNLILKPLYMYDDVNENVFTNSIALGLPILGEEDENGNFVHLFFNSNFYAKKIVQNI